MPVDPGKAGDNVGSTDKEGAVLSPGNLLGADRQPHGGRGTRRIDGKTGGTDAQPLRHPLEVVLRQVRHLDVLIGFDILGIAFDTGPDNTGSRWDRRDLVKNSAC